MLLTLKGPSFERVIAAGDGFGVSCPVDLCEKSYQIHCRLSSRYNEAIHSINKIGLNISFHYQYNAGEC